MIRYVGPLLLVGAVFTLIAVGTSCPPEEVKADELCPKYPTCTQEEFLARRASNTHVAHQGNTKKGAVVVDIVDVELFGNGRYSVREAYSDRILADQIVDRLRNELRGEFVTKSEFLQAIRAMKEGDPGEGWKPPQKPSPSPDPMPKIGPTSPIQEIFDRSCVSCHSGDRPSGDVDLTDETALSKLEKSAVFGQIALGAMPRSGDPLPDAEAALVGRWAVGK